jgi:methylmalonyl-CoA mutase
LTFGYVYLPRSKSPPDGLAAVANCLRRGVLTSELPLQLAAEFPPSTREEWRRGVDRVLAKGKSDLTERELATRFDRQLVTRLYDDIAVAPLYTATDVAHDTAEGLPGLPPFLRGATLLGGAEGGWDIRQPVDVSPADPARTGALVLEQLERGASSLILRAPLRTPPEGPAELDVELLDRILEGVYLDLITVSLHASLGPEAPEALLALWDRQGVEKSGARGVLGLDPIGEHASRGGGPDLAAAQRAMITVAQRCSDTYPQVRAVVVDVTRYHEAGCADSEELACAIATGVAYLRMLTEAGLSLDAAFGQIEFRFAATADQFLTVAKLRAARWLWSRVAQACGRGAAGAQRQHAVSSRAMLSRYDPWVNLLRGTIACFGAGIGGADAVTIEPYDLLVEPGLVSELGRRMARNTQIILLEESHAAKVIDPAGGSWYVESLTQSVARESWSWFQAIESEGGMVAALESGLVTERIEQTWERRLDNLARRGDTITGVSDFPNANEEIPVPPAATRSGGGLPRRRYAAPFEELRERVDAHTRRVGERPSVLLVTIGSAADYTARATYAKSFFEIAGFATDMLEVDDRFEERLAAQVLAGAKVACLCSSDACYIETGPTVVRHLEADLERLYVAGRRSDDLAPLAEAGVDEFIGVGCNVLDSLRGVLAVLGVE